MTVFRRLRVGTMPQFQIVDKARSRSLQVALLALVVLLGILLRLHYYAQGYSFFLDECALAVNVAQRSFAGLSQTLDYDQAAPLAFLWTAKTLISFYPQSEAALRLISIAASAFGLCLFAYLAWKFIQGYAAIAATTLYAMNYLAIFQSTQFKQYSVELLSSSLLIWAATRLSGKSATVRQCLAPLLVGLLLPWFAFTSIFALGAVAAALLLEQRPWSFGMWKTPLGLTLLLWALAFPLAFQFSYSPGMANPALHAMWTKDYLPWTSAQDMGSWLMAKLGELGSLSLHSRFWIAGSLLLLIGCGRALRSPSLLPRLSCLAVAACLAAAVLQRYPFSGRFLLFLLPFTCILLVEGYRGISGTLSKGGQVLLRVAASATLAWTIVSSSKQFTVSKGFVDEPRLALEFLRQNLKADDALHATRLATPCVMYYQLFLGTPLSRWQLGLNKANMPATRRLSPGRHWLIEMRTPWEPVGESQFVHEHFASQGSALLRKDVQWTSATLFQMGPVMPEKP